MYTHLIVSKIILRVYWLLIPFLIRARARCWEEVTSTNIVEQQLTPKKCCLDSKRINSYFSGPLVSPYFEKRANFFGILWPWIHCHITLCWLMWIIFQLLFLPICSFSSDLKKVFYFLQVIIISIVRLSALKNKQEENFWVYWEFGIKT